MRKDPKARILSSSPAFSRARASAAAGEAKLEQLKKQARREAAGVGADAVIIAVDSASAGPQMGVYEEPELFLSALAIKYVTAASTPTAK